MKAIVINGPMGVGKTTVGKYIADTHPGTAFIDGDWCLDLHPFVGNRETKEMAIDNILHMVGNYQRCSVCRMIVLVWLMDEPWVQRSIADGMAAMGLEVRHATLICSKDELIKRWTHDDKCEWRTDDWLGTSLESLTQFSAQEHCIDTSGLSIPQIAEAIIK